MDVEKKIVRLFRVKSWKGGFLITLVIKLLRDIFVTPPF